MQQPWPPNMGPPPRGTGSIPPFPAASPRDPYGMGGMFDVKERTFQAPDPVDLVLEANVGRIYVCFYTFASVYVSLLNDPPTAHGILVGNPPGVPMLAFDFRTHGTLPSQAWYAKDESGFSLLTIIEVIYRPRR